MQKSQALVSLGQRGLLLPVWVKAALAANDRLKLYLTVVQAAASHADHPHQDVPDLTRELAAVLELFAERLNDAQQANKHFATSVERPWRVVAGESLTGELDGSMWGSRLLERWVVRDLRLLHRICPIREVVVEARYTGATYRIATTVSV